MSDIFSFRLLEEFVNKYKEVAPPFGFSDAGSNSLGEITFIRTYSRVKEDGTKEKWYEVCKRVVEGMYSVQKNHAKENRLPWNDQKAQKSAQEAYERMFQLKWTPPGRGLWAFGTPMVMEKRNSSSLQNCAMVSTKDIDRNDPGDLFAWVMDALMLGIGVGFDTLGNEKEMTIFSPTEPPSIYEIPDTREGWVESVRLLINSFLRQNQSIQEFNYDIIRPLGAPIKGFGGVASGPAPLIDLHVRIKNVIGSRAGELLDSRAIVDIVNLIGTCVVSGNVRRCLAFDSPVQTTRGPVEIQHISVGDKVVVGGKEYPVSAKVDSGVQKTLKIKHRFGSIEVTPNHRVAVFDSFNKYSFKEAITLNPGDRLVWDSAGYEGKEQYLPVLQKNKHFNSLPSNVPKKLTTDVAWLIGYVHGDGHINKHMDSIEISAHENYIGVLEKAQEIFSKDFGVNVKISSGSGNKGEKYNRIRIHRTSLGKWFFDYIKKSKEPIVIPEFIIRSGIETRSAYLAGLMDADGRTRHDGVIEICATKYEKFAEQIISMLSGMGVGSSVSITDNRGEDFYAIKAIGNTSRMKAKELLQQYAVSGKLERLPEQLKSSVDFSYPFSMVGVELGIKGWKPQGSITNRWLVENNFDTGMFFPSEVLFIEDSRTVQTYDIEVEEVHQFVTNGIVVHNSATLALGDPNDKDFINLKNAKVFPERNSYDPENPGWAYMSNNSISAKPETKYEDYVDLISNNGEPGFIWLDVTRNFGRLADPADGKDYRVSGFNPCSEQPLESYETCNLIEVHLNRHNSKEDFMRTLKFAYLYGKTVTLIPTHWQKTNGIMQRNRRIGTSLTGIASFADTYGLPVIREWMDEGYKKIRYYDNKYSEWLCIRESIRVTTVKPSGSVSLLSGNTPGVHWGPGGKFYLRAIRFAKQDKMMHLFKAAGYKIEQDIYSAETMVVYFPIASEHARSEKDVSLFEKIGLAATAQKYWSDNGVSVTVSFDKEGESKFIAPALYMYEGQLKAVSFLPMGNKTYPQQPYTSITKEEYESYVGQIAKINWDAIYDGVENLEALGEAYCNNDNCII